VSLVILPGTLGLITNTATVSANGSDLNPANNSLQETTSVVPAADLTLQVLDTPDPVTAGELITYGITITNQGPSGATLVTLRDALPPSLTYISGSWSQGSCSSAGGLVTCNLGSIPSLGFATVNLLLRPNQVGLISNWASVSTGTDDPNAANNGTSTLSRVNSRPTLSALGNQTISEDAILGPLTFTVGDAETPAANLQMTGFSSNPSVVPDANIVFGGSGATRTLTVTPSANQFGTVQITRIVTTPMARQPPTRLI